MSSPFGDEWLDEPGVKLKAWEGIQNVRPDDKTLWDEFEAVGSRITCDPPPTDTDEDWIILSENNDKNLIKILIEEYGFERGGSDLVDDEDSDQDYSFISLKLGRVNLIITPSSKFYRRFLAASSVAKRLNLLDKEDRIALFQAVLYGNSCHMKYNGASQ